MKKYVAILALTTSVSFAYADTATTQSVDQIPQNGQNMYQNPDLLLTNQVQDVIQTRFPNKYTSVKVTANNGYVTLQGNVASQDDKNTLEQTVSGIPGVQGVNNQLTIQATNGQAAAVNGQGAAAGEQAIVAKVQDTLRTVFFNRYPNVKVSFENGQVTLRGVVPSQADKTAIETTVNKIVGEKGVNSQLIVQGNS